MKKAATHTKELAIWTDTDAETQTAENKGPCEDG